MINLIVQHDSELNQKLNDILDTIQANHKVVVDYLSANYPEVKKWYAYTRKHIGGLAGIITPEKPRGFKKFHEGYCPRVDNKKVTAEWKALPKVDKKVLKEVLAWDLYHYETDEGHVYRFFPPVLLKKDNHKMKVDTNIFKQWTPPAGIIRVNPTVKNLGHASTR